MLKNIATSLLLFISLACGTITAKPIVGPAAPCPTFEVAFSPKKGARDLIISNIDNAKKSIHVAAYSFTSTAIAEALERAHKRGIDVKIVLDKKRATERGTICASLKSKKIPFRINNRYPIMHNKFMIIDAATVQVGSFNYTKAAEKSNAENVLIINNCPELAKQYLTEWQRLWNESGVNYANKRN
jgi:phosphatidylserine/phosphatidylglycerophosphate/cardiolipin synthase-like enzyme